MSNVAAAAAPRVVSANCPRRRRRDPASLPARSPDLVLVVGLAARVEPKVLARVAFRFKQRRRRRRAAAAERLGLPAAFRLVGVLEALREAAKRAALLR